MSHKILSLFDNCMKFPYVFFFLIKLTPHYFSKLHEIPLWFIKSSQLYIFFSK